MKSIFAKADSSYVMRDSEEVSYDCKKTRAGYYLEALELCGKYSWFDLLSREDIIEYAKNLYKKKVFDFFGIILRLKY